MNIAALLFYVYCTFHAGSPIPRPPPSVFAIKNGAVRTPGNEATLQVGNRLVVD